MPHKQLSFPDDNSSRANAVAGGPHLGTLPWTLCEWALFSQRKPRAINVPRNVFDEFPRSPHERSQRINCLRTGVLPAEVMGLRETPAKRAVDSRQLDGSHVPGEIAEECGWLAPKAAGKVRLPVSSCVRKELFAAAAMDNSSHMSSNSWPKDSASGKRGARLDNCSTEWTQFPTYA